MQRSLEHRMPTLTTEIIEAAILGFEQQKSKIDDQMAELRAMLPGSSAPVNTRAEDSTPKRSMSAAGRRAIAEAKRKQWAASRGESAPVAKKKTAKKSKRKLSPEG